MTIPSEINTAVTSGGVANPSQSIRLEEDSLKNIRHEMRTPIHSILGFVDLLSGQFFGELNTKQAHYVKQIETNTSHLLFLLNSLFDILKIDFNEMALELTAVSAEDFINTAVSMMGDQLMEGGAAVNVSIAPGLPPVIADIKRCEQITANAVAIILKNSSPKDTIKISASKTEGPYVVIKINNIDGNNSRENQNTAESGKETPMPDVNFEEESIRFALTRRLVELHGGKIGLDYTTYPKSEIWFTLRQKNGGEGE